MVRRDAFDPGRLVSPHGYEVLAPLFAVNLPDRSSQILGYPPATQRSLDTSEDAICLLQLGSYSAVGWMFADMGEGSYWIKRADLVGQDFRRAWARVE